MGMAASQARLLTITARLHDVEYQAQSIQNAKIQLATQQDNIYQDYLAALDACTLTVKDWQGNMMTANFNNLCGKNPVDSGNKYALKASNGKLIVPADIKEAYDTFVENYNGTAYEFAVYCINGDGGNSFMGNIEELEEETFQEHQDDTSDDMKKMNGLQEKMAEILNGRDYNDNEITPEEREKYDKYKAQFDHLLYKNYGAEICQKEYPEDMSVEDFNEADFNYYVNIFKQIQASGGCISISSYDGFNGDASTDSDWLKNMIQCGKITLEIVKQDNKTGEISFITSSPDSDTYVSYTTTTTIDKTAYAKAEAEYEHKTKELDRKDKKFDMDLSKLETERTALTTEYESVKKVINDNIERTFGIFS